MCYFSKQTYQNEFFGFIKLKIQLFMYKGYIFKKYCEISITYSDLSTINL